METDEKIIPEENQDTTPSVAEEKQESVPYSRFKEVIDQKNKMGDDVKFLREEFETFKQRQPEKEEEEPLDWRQAEERAVNKALLAMEKKNKESADKEHQNDLAIEKGFDQLIAMGKEVTPAIKKAVLTKMIQSGDTDVIDTFLSIEKKAEETDKVEQIKKEGAIPSSQKGSEAGKSNLPYKELRNKSLDEIVEGISEAK